jgi:Zn finger protein HypA/HybF involved in hydrogenase expression
MAKKECQCSDCGEFVDFLVDDGICEDCFKKKD